MGTKLLWSCILGGWLSVSNSNDRTSMDTVILFIVII